MMTLGANVGSEPDSSWRDPGPDGTPSPSQAMAFLARRFGDGVRDVSPIGHGEWSRAFTFRHDEADCVVRFSALAEDFAKDRLAARYASLTLPIPAVIEMGEAFGGFYAISKRATGDYLDDLDAARLRALLPALFAALDTARQVDLSHTTGFGLWGADGNAPHSTWRDALLDVAHDRPVDRAHGWRERLAASATGSEPFAEAFAHLETLVADCPEARHLVHSDLLNLNVFVQDDRISAVIDWGCSLFGDFLYDLAWFLFWAPWYPAWQSIDFQAEAARHFAAIGLAVPQFNERLRCYQIPHRPGGTGI